MTRALGVMEVPVPLTADDLHQYQTGALRDGGLWTALRRLSDHDHSGGHGGAPVAGGGGGTADVTITGTEGLTVVEAPANVFALGLTASPDAANTIEIRSNGIYSASGAIPPEYVTDAELATALGPYATDTDLANHAAAADPHPTYTTATELSTAITAHAGAADPHPTYSTAAELTSAITAHEGLANPHPTYATDADLTAHAGAADPHPTYSTAAEVTTAITAHEGLANPHPTYTTDAEVATAISTHAGAADPHPTYLTAAEGNAAYATGTHNHDTAYVNLAGGSVMTGLLGPTTTNTRDLGTTALRWRKAWAVDIESTNAPTINGVSMDSRYATPASITSAITTHEGAANPHPTYATDADLTTHAGAADPHPVYSTAAEVTSAVTAHEGLADPHPTYLTAAEGNALYRPISYVTDVTITPDASLTATESPANTFALAARLSPDGGNALALRANGLYATVPGGSGLPTTGGTMTGSIAVGTTNLYDLGATALRWRKLWATDVETTNTPTVGGTALPTFTTADARYLQSATATTTYVPLAGGSVLTGLLGPTTTNTRDLGTTALRWRKLWAVDGEFTNVPTVGGVSLDTRYALASALTALTTRVTTLEAQVATLQAQMTGHTHTSGTIDAMGGTAVMP